MAMTVGEFKNMVSFMLDHPESFTVDVVKNFISSSNPTCATEGIGSTAKEASKRASPTPWDVEVTYIDQKGEPTKFSSPSALTKSLNLPMSGIQCDVQGQKCRAQSVVEILRVHGYHVRGNGEGTEPKKSSEGGKTMTVINPNAPQLKAAAPPPAAAPPKQAAPVTAKKK